MTAPVTREEILEAKKILKRWITTSASNGEARRKCELILKVIEGLSK